METLKIIILVINIIFYILLGGYLAYSAIKIRKLERQLSNDFIQLRKPEKGFMQIMYFDKSPEEMVNSKTIYTEVPTTEQIEQMLHTQIESYINGCVKHNLKTQLITFKQRLLSCNKFEYLTQIDKHINSL